MPLPWIRLDTNLPSHDKILDLVDRYRRDGMATAFVYVASLTYCGHNGTDGLITRSALPLIHGTKRDADRLVEVRLWALVERGWFVPNYLARNEESSVTEAKAAAQIVAGRKAACARWHEDGCTCWKEGS